jgi:hypothetical protein
MAYKFQNLAARMSGSLTQEGDFLVFDHSNAEKASIGIDGHMSGSGALSAGGNLRTAGTVRFDGVADAALAVASDSFYYLDSDGLMKRDTMADYATAIAGDGLAASSGVLSVSLTELTEAAVNVGADSLIFIDADGNVTRRDTFADYATAAAGDGLAAASGVLAVAVSGAVHVASDKVSLSGSITGDALDFAGGVDSISTIHVVADESTIEAAGRASLRIKDDGVTGAKLAPAVAGYGISQDGSGNLDLDLNELTAETIAAGDFLAFVDNTDNGTHKETVDDLATLFAGTGLAASSAVLSVDLNELGAAAVNVGADSIAIVDADDSNASKKESIADLMTAVAGDGLAAASGVLSVSLTELTEAAVNVGADSLIFIDADGNVTRKDTFADYATALAGDALAAASGVLAVQTSGSALTIASDKLGISGSIAGDCLDSGPGDGVDSIRTLHVVADESTIESVGRSSLQIKDDGVTGAKLAPAVAGAGLVQDGSGNLDIGAGSLIDVQADQIDVDLTEAAAATIADGDFLIFLDGGTAGAESKGSTADLAALLDGAGLTRTNSTLAVVNATNGGIGVQAADIKVDLNDLAAAAVDVANDSIAIIDANDSNGTKKESIADLATGMAGAGLTATSGVLSVTGNNVALKQDGDTLAEGYNYFANASSDATVSMPANPAVGDVVTIKAGNLTSNANIIVNPQGSHEIDGLTQIRLESPFASVTCVYVVANDWRIV